jgi:hypothetical protein
VLMGEEFGERSLPELSIYMMLCEFFEWLVTGSFNI